MRGSVGVKILWICGNVCVVNFPFYKSKVKDYVETGMQLVMKVTLIAFLCGSEERVIKK